MVRRPATRDPEDRSFSGEAPRARPVPMMRHIVSGALIAAVSLIGAPTPPPRNTPPTATERPRGEPLHGVRGRGFRDGRIVQIDYPKRRVRFFATSREAEEVARRIGRDELVVPLPMLPDDVAPILDVEVNGQPVHVTLDTGSSLGLELFGPALRRLGPGDQGVGARPDTVGTRGRATRTMGVVITPTVKIRGRAAIEAT